MRVKVLEVDRQEDASRLSITRNVDAALSTAAPL